MHNFFDIFISPPCIEIDRSKIVNQHIKWPRRRLIIFLERYLYLILCIGLSFFLAFSVKYELDSISKDIFFLFLYSSWIIFSFCSAILHIIYVGKQQSLITSNHIIEKIQVFLIGSIFVLSIIIQFKSSLFLNTDSWLWVIYIYPCLIASEYLSSYPFLTFLFISSFSMLIIDFQKSRILLNSLYPLRNIIPLFNKSFALIAITFARYLSIKRNRSFIDRNNKLSELFSKLENAKGENLQIQIDMNVAKSIADLFGYEKIFIFLINNKGDKLVLKNGYVSPHLLKRKIYLNVESNSICTKVYKSNKIHLARRVHSHFSGNCIHFKNDPFFPPKTRSELAVPLMLFGIPIGVLDIQSKVSNDFTESDIEFLISIADLISMYFKNEVNVLNKIYSEPSFKDFHHEINQNLNPSGNIKAIFNDLCKTLVGRFKFDLITLFLLSPEINYPIQPPLFFGDFHDTTELESMYLSYKSLLFTCINQWKSIYELPWSNFQEREKVKLGIFIPIGSPKDKVGLLFLNFRKKRDSDPLFIYELERIVYQFSLMMIKIREDQLRSSSLFVSHDNQHHNTKLNLIYMLSAMKTYRDQGNISISEIDNMITSVQEILRNEIIRKHDNEFEQKSPTYLESSLHNFVNTLITISKQTFRYSLEIDRELFSLGKMINNAIYSFLSEFLINSIFHGSSTFIDIKVRKGRNRISVLCVNDGKPFNVNEKRMEYLKGSGSSHGLFAQEEEFKNIFGVKSLSITSIDKKGVEIFFQIPLFEIEE